MMELQQYVERLRETPLREVSFGYQTVTLFDAEELKDAQIGYRVGEKGEDFVSTEAGHWLEGWYVIGSDDLVGDPLFVDIAEERLPVYTAEHGEGHWEPERIAASFEGFLYALEQIQAASAGRETPAAVEENPLPGADRELTLSRIEGANPGASIDYWENWLSES